MEGVSTELAIILLLLLGNGVFAMSEIAMVSARKAKLKQLADEGDAQAARALAIANEPTRFLSTVQVGITLIGTLAGAFGGARVADNLVAYFETVAFLAPYATALGMGLVVVAITLLSVIIGELVPKRLGLTNPERIAMAVAGPMSFVSRIAYPIVHLLTVTTEGILKIFGVRPSKDAPVTEEEVNILIEQGMQAGVFNRAEKEMVAGVLELDQMSVTALMTPRPKMVFLNLDDPEETNWRKIVASGHSHFPVYQGNRDHVLGMVAVKAIWANSAFGLSTNLRNLLTPPVVVPETMMAIQLLEQFKRTGKHLALVSDEFGSIQGLVTINDVFEAIVGALPESGQRAAPEAKQREDGSWLIDATLATDDLKTLLSLDELPHEDKTDFQTLGGFVMTHFGRIPAASDYFEHEGWRFEVVDMDRHRIDKVLVSRAASAAVQKAAS
ncbi:MAG TPA: hemolysin family protein [Opitutaceae bacterium]